MNRTVRIWNGFFFSQIDDRVYRFLRISIGAILAVYLLVLGPDWMRWFSESGVLDGESARRSIDPDTWSVFHWLPETSPVLWWVYGIVCLQCVLLIVGVQSKFQVVCLFIWFLSMHHRNHLIWEGGDVLLRITLFLMMFMPLGNRLPRKERGKRRRVTVWPLRLLQIQQSVLYFSSVGQKMKGADWMDGVAVYYTSHLDDFSGRILSIPIPVEHLWISQLASWTTIAIEMLLVFAVWMPSMRRSAVVLGITFHLILELSMNLFIFQWLMILILITHLFKIERSADSPI